MSGATNPVYVCWCDSEDGCEGAASEPFGLCAQCEQLGHGIAPRHGLTADDLRVT